MEGKEVIVTRRYGAPCGVLVLGAYGGRLCLCDWEDCGNRVRVRDRLRRRLGAEFAEGESPVTDMAAGELDEYFAGRRREFDVPLLFVGTDFQETVWEALRCIPYGETVSYGELARRIGRPNAVRGVANANGANAVSIFAPCHRVIGSDSALTGYAGGVAAKEYMLRLEKYGRSDWPARLRTAADSGMAPKSIPNGGTRLEPL